MFQKNYILNMLKFLQTQNIVFIKFICTVIILSELIRLILNIESEIINNITNSIYK